MRRSRHFHVQKLAEGVFAAVATNGGAAISNSGIIDLGDRTLIYDTFMTPQAAQDLRAIAQELTGRDPGIIINSHYHNDHIWGNQAFGTQAHICCTARTLELILTEGKEELRSARETSAQRLQESRQKYEEVQDEHQRRDLLTWVGYYQGLVADLPALEVRLPDITFEDRLSFHGSSLSVELIPFEGAHSGSDAILYLRQKAVVFMADLLFVNSHPYLAEGDVHKLLQALRQVNEMHAAVLVPGHGSVGTSTDLALNIDYISTCVETAQRLVAAGDTSLERIQQQRMPDRFSSWELPRFFSINLQSLCRKLEGAQKSA